MTVEQFYNAGAPILFSDNGDVQMTLAGLGNGAGRVSNLYDLGAWPGVRTFRWDATVKLAAAASALGASFEWYLAKWNSDGGPGDPDGDVGVADSAMPAISSSVDWRKNLQSIGACFIDKTASGSLLRASGFIFIPARYISIAAYNGLGVSISATPNDNWFRLTPVYGRAVTVA